MNPFTTAGKERFAARPHELATTLCASARSVGLLPSVGSKQTKIVPDGHAVPDWCNSASPACPRLSLFCSASWVQALQRTATVIASVRHIGAAAVLRLNEMPVLSMIVFPGVRV